MTAASGVITWSSNHIFSVMFKTMRYVDDYAQTALVDEQTFFMTNVCVCVYVSSFGII